MTRGRISLQAVTLCVGLMLVSGCSSVTFVRSNTLARISAHSSAYNSDYAEYQRGHLNKTQLMDRLPHIALIGDSLSRNFHITSLPGSVLRAKLNHRRDWFLDTDPSTNSIDSVYERVEALTPLVATEYASPGGCVDSGVKANHLFGFLLPLNFSEQVDLILSNRRFPDLLMIWIGHNNVNWVYSLNSKQRQNPDVYLKEMTDNYRKNYARQLQRLLDQAKRDKHRTAIVVFGLVNFESFFKARQATEELKRANSNLYPYLDTDYRYFESMKPEYRANMIKLALMMNEELRGLVAEFNKQLEKNSQVTLRYSDALATVDISRADLIHRIDAWHPSPKGHGVLAGAAFGALGPSLEFLGIAPK